MEFKNKFYFTKYTKYLIFLLGVIMTWTSLQILPLFLNNVNNLMPFGLKLMIVQHTLFLFLATGLLRWPRASFYPVPDDADWRPLPLWATFLANCIATLIVCSLSIGNVDDEALTTTSNDFILLNKIQDNEILNDQDFVRLGELYTAAFYNQNYTPFKSATIERMTLSLKQQLLLNRLDDNSAYLSRLIKKSSLGNLSKFNENTLKNMDRRVTALLNQAVKGDWVIDKLEKNLRKGILKPPSDLWTSKGQLRALKSVHDAIEYHALRNGMTPADAVQAFQSKMKRNLEKLDDYYWSNYSKLKSEADKSLELRNMSISEKTGQILGGVTKRAANISNDLFSPVISVLDDFKKGVGKGLED